jgi:GTP cyclohydrolase I
VTELLSGPAAAPTTASLVPGAPAPLPMVDVQNRPDDRGLALDEVGVRDLRCPIQVLDRSDGRQTTVATLSLAVSLPHHFKGTHMSRFVEVLDAHRGEVTMRTLPALLADLRRRLDAAAAHVSVRFPYFLERRAPVSGARALMDYQCTFTGRADGDDADFVLAVEVPVTSLCPCSKEISDYGAHNQRGHITLEVRGVRQADGAPALIWIEELVDLAERSASAPVYPLLKRVDERHVTMQAYENPVFVEDMVRNVAHTLRDDPRVAWFRVGAVNQESIHNHDAFATITWARP